MNKPKIIKLSKLGEPNFGYISVVEENINVPFTIKRVYWTYHTPSSVIRGGHAHKKLEQLIIAVSGVIDFELIDYKGNKQNYKLDKPNMGLFIPRGYWRNIRFSQNAVLLCLASDVFKESDYIRNFEVFMNNKNSNC